MSVRVVGSVAFNRSNNLRLTRAKWRYRTSSSWCNWHTRNRFTSSPSKSLSTSRAEGFFWKSTCAPPANASTYVLCFGNISMIVFARRCFPPIYEKGPTISLFEVSGPCTGEDTSTQAHAKHGIRLSDGGKNKRCRKLHDRKLLSTPRRVTVTFSETHLSERKFENKKSGLPQNPGFLAKATYAATTSSTSFRKRTANALISFSSWFQNSPVGGTTCEFASL